jgi:hypothetical protein
MDASVRGANVGLRTDLIVVKGRTADDAFKIPSTLEKIPAIAALKNTRKLEDEVTEHSWNFYWRQTTKAFALRYP